MSLGPGKYDDLCTLVRERAGVSEKGGVILIVFDGDKGNGFACQTSEGLMRLIPDILEGMANKIRKDSTT